MMAPNDQLNKCNGGFTLIEMALVMIIGGVVLSLLGSALITYVEKSRIDKTEYRMEAIKEALSQYLSVNRRYPCPARRNVAPGSNNFGLEPNTSCTGNIGGTVQTNTGNPLDQRVRIGSVPTRTLNLSDEMGIDGWGNRFTYAVTINQARLTGSGATSRSTFTNDGGEIRISDSSGTTFVNDAHYVIVSHGKTGGGAFNVNGNRVSPCRSGASAPLDERRNCDDNRTFTTTILNVSANNNQFYDDYLYYQGQTAPVLLIPTGAVMAFDLDNCPDGWEDFSGAEGRFIIGAGSGNRNYRDMQVYIPFDSTGNGVDNTNARYRVTQHPTSSQTASNNISRGQNTRHTTSENLIPPYYALKYCRKLAN